MLSPGVKTKREWREYAGKQLKMFYDLFHGTQWTEYGVDEGRNLNAANKDILYSWACFAIYGLPEIVSKDGNLYEAYPEAQQNHAKELADTLFNVKDLNSINNTVNSSDLLINAHIFNRFSKKAMHPNFSLALPILSAKKTMRMRRSNFTFIPFSRCT